MTSTTCDRDSLIPLERMDTVSVLAVVEPFVVSRPLELEQLAHHATRLRKPAGSVLIEEGNAADGMYILLRGRINLLRVVEGGRDLIVSVLGRGDVLGESCVFAEHPMATSAVTAMPCELLRISPEILVEHLKRNPDTMLRLLRLQHDKLQQIEAIAGELALCGVEERLRQTLVRLVKRQGRQLEEGKEWILAPVPTQSELARMVGSCRETVSRTLSAMARNGLVTASGRRMIVNPSLLREQQA